MNFEDEIEIKLLDNFQYRFGLKEDILLRYLYIRYLCITNEKISFAKYIEEESFIEGLKYKDNKISILNGFDNSIGNICENILFRLKLKPITVNNGVILSFNAYISSTMNDIKKHSKWKSDKYKKEKNYNNIYMYYKLKRLNELFNTKLNPPKKIEGFNYSDEFFPITKEEELERYIHVSNFKTNNIGTITEKILSDYIYKNLEKIEEGLIYLGREVIINEGRIDILALDRNNDYVIIELKVVEDKELLWQVIYYPIQLKEEKKLNKVRVITICPFYKEHILKALKTVDNISCYKYIADIENSKIIDMNFIKIF